MIAVNASTSPHSSATFTLFGKEHAHFGRRTKGWRSPGFRPTHFIASRRKIHRRNAALPRLSPLGGPIKLNRDERRA